MIDRYAMVNFRSTFYNEAVASNYGDYIAMDENGKYYNDLESNETLDALNWLLECWTPMTIRSLREANGITG